MPFIDSSGLYYEGERASINDIEVPERPSIYHMYSKKARQWILDNDKVLDLKRRILNQLENDLKSKLTLLNLTEEEKENLQKEYNLKIDQLSSSNDPQIIEKIKL